MSNKFTSITSGGDNIPVYDKAAHQALSGKQDTIEFAYNDDDAISAINGSALAGQGGSVELSSRTILVDDNLIDTTLSARKVTYLNCLPDGTPLTQDMQNSGIYPYDLSGNTIPSFTSTCYSFQYMNNKTNRSGTSGCLFSPIVFHKDEFTESGDYYVKEVTLADGLWESNQIEFLHTEGSGLYSWSMNGSAYISNQQNMFPESGYSYCPVPFSGELYDDEGNVFAHTNYYFEGGSGGPMGPCVYSGGWASGGSAYVGPVNARIIVPKSGFDYWFYYDNGSHYVADSADIPEGITQSSHYKMSSFALTAYISPSWTISGVAYSQPTYIVDEQRLNYLFGYPSGNWNKAYNTVNANSANWNQASAANAILQANKDSWNNKQDQILSGYDNTASAVWYDIPGVGGIIGTTTSSLNTTYSGTRTFNENFTRSDSTYYGSYVAYYPFTAKTTSGRWRVSANVNGWSAGVFTASGGWNTSNALPNSIAFNSYGERNWNFSGMTPGQKYYLGITGIYNANYNNFSGVVSGSEQYTSAINVSGILAGGLPAGVMNTSGIEFDGNGSISGYAGSAIAAGVDPSLLKETSAGPNIDISETNDAIIISGKDWTAEISGKADTSGFELDGNGHISAYNGSAFAGQGGGGGGDYVPLSAIFVSVGSGNSAVSSDTNTFMQGTNNRAKENGEFVQGDSNTAQRYSIAQGYKNSAYYKGFAQGQNNSAASDSIAQGIQNKAEYYSFAQGDYNSASYTGFSQGYTNSSEYASFAQGYKNSAANTAMAQGYMNSADYRSIAVGYQCSAKSKGVAIGESNSANDQSFALGWNNKAWLNSEALGSNNSAVSYSLALGGNCKASGNSLAQGNSPTAIDYSISQGSNTFASGYSQSFGGSNTAYDYSQTFGYGNAMSASGMAIGKYNKTSAGAAFVVGNGSGYQASARSDAFVIFKDGSVSAAGKISAAGVELGGGGGGASYSAGANIDITDNVISGRDWTDDIASATSGLQPSGDYASASDLANYQPVSSMTAFQAAGDYASASDIPETKSLSAGNGIDIAVSNDAVTFSFTGVNVVYTASQPANPDANTLYLIPEA